MVNKLISLAGNNPNENERIAAALKACQLIRDNNLLGQVGSPRQPEVQASVDNDIKEFYHKIIIMNGTPKTILNARLVRCRVCQGTIRIGESCAWIPKTAYCFHHVCYNSIKMGTEPR